MRRLPTIAIIDAGKTNKKLLLFEEQYRVVYEKSNPLAETKDEDGDACEDIQQLNQFVYSSLREIFESTEFEVKAVNYTAYGASFVYIDKTGNSLTPLYNYLK